jgi:hypothetical protein
MRCEENIQNLIDAAALGQPPEVSIAHHMQSCADCRSRFQREQSLFAAIDDAIHTRMSESPRPGFLVRASARLSKEPVANDAVNPTWAAVPVLVLALLASTRPWNKSQQPPVTATSTGPAVTAQQHISTATSARETNQASSVGRPQKSFDSRSQVGNATPKEPEVLVPPDEQQAFAQFVARVAGQDAMAAAVVSQAPDKTIPANAALPQVSSVDVAQLEPVRRNDSMDGTDGSE